MTVAENIFMDRSMGRIYSRRRLNRLVQELLDEYGFQLDSAMRVERLSPVNQQIVGRELNGSFPSRQTAPDPEPQSAAAAYAFGK